MTTIDRILVPEALLKSQLLLPSAKLVYIALALDTELRPKVRKSKIRLAEMTGLSRPTIYKALAALRAGGWYDQATLLVREHQTPMISIFADVLLDTSLSVSARLFHGMLQLTQSFKNNSMNFRYSSLGDELQMGVRTIRHAVNQLVKSRWLVKKQANQLTSISLILCNPIKEQFKAMMVRAKKNLKRAQYKGEALMKEFLSLIISTEDYVDNARPGFLRNFDTDGLMEFDRYYSKVMAFEFNGIQHYMPTERYSIEVVEKQKARDMLKMQLAEENGVKLVVIRPEDLTINGILTKIGDSLPLRNIQSGERLANYLEWLSARYRRKIPELTLS